MLKSLPNEVNVVLLHVPVEPLKQISGCVTFLGNDIMNVY